MKHIKRNQMADRVFTLPAIKISLTVIYIPRIGIL